MTLLTIFYTVLFYFATGVFVIGLAVKIRSYAKTPAPLKIATTPGAGKRPAV
jgi:nitrate reductase gamma subunit